MLRVWVDSRNCGVLDRSTMHGSTFVYDIGAEARDAVSLTMPKRTESWDVPYGLLPVFDMNLPEGALRERLKSRFAKAAGTFDDFDLLSVVGRSQVGRIRFTGVDERLQEDVPFQSVDEILRSRRDGELFEYLLSTFDVYSGLAGVQPKVMIRGEEAPEHEEATGARLSPSVKGATHIVKLWDPEEYPELAANEFFCLSAAMEVGLELPAFDLSDDGMALVVERFDRSDEGYLGFEDFCVLNGVRSDDKYAGGYETKLFRRIRDFVSPNRSAEALESAFRLFVLNCALRNGDAHLKNFGVVYEDTLSSVGLAPAYDLITTRVYLPKDGMALTLEGSTNWPDRKKIERLGRTRADLRPARVAEIIEQTCDAITDVAPRVARYFSESEYGWVGSRMLEQWADGVRGLNGQRTVVQIPEQDAAEEHLKPR